VVRRSRAKAIALDHDDGGDGVIVVGLSVVASAVAVVNDVDVIFSIAKTSQ